jgi:hypothetical protein
MKLVRLTTLIFVPLAAWLLLAPAGDLRAGEDPGARLREMLAGNEPLGNTIPLEQEILALRDAGEAGALLEFAGHERFGFLVLWALTEIARPETEAAVLKAFAALPIAERAGAAVWLAAFRSDGVRAALRALRAEKELPEGSRGAVDAALLRAGDEKADGAVRAALDGTDADAIARALLLAGDARRADLLPEAAKRATDARKLAAPVASVFPVRVRTEIPGGWSETTTYPELATLGEVAVEAASRMAKPLTPEMIAWWYEPEKGARFPNDEAGRRLLAAWVEAEAKAAAAMGPGSGAAVAKLFAGLRGKHPDFLDVRITGISFDGAFRFTCLVNGDEVATRIE